VHNPDSISFLFVFVTYACTRCAKYGVDRRPIKRRSGWHSQGAPWLAEFLIVTGRKVFINRG